MALLRRHFRHLIFTAGARDIAERRSVYSSLTETTTAAEHAIAAAFQIAGSPPAWRFWPWEIRDA